jgi:5-oxoprolinase (ATP-hydrolysing) subunit A
VKHIDLNCDMGEMPEALADGTQEALLQFVTSANVACGGHAGDEQMMRATIQQAQRAGVAVGAHPGYEDRANFGRNELQLKPEEIAASVHKQILALAAVAKECGVPIGYVKPHGALYNQAARNPQIALAIAAGVRRWRTDVPLMGLAGSPMLEVFREAGFPTVAEAFADRRYEADGSLRSRTFEDALLQIPGEASAQALRMVQQGSVIVADGTIVPIQAQTICIHGDTPGAVAIAETVNQVLRQAGIRLKAIGA